MLKNAIKHLQWIRRQVLKPDKMHRNSVFFSGLGQPKLMEGLPARQFLDSKRLPIVFEAFVEVLLNNGLVLSLAAPEVEHRSHYV